MKKNYLFILFLISSISHADCDLKSGFSSYLDFLKVNPRVSLIKQQVAFEDYERAVIELAKEDGEKLTDHLINLKSSHYLLLSAWIDSRIVEIKKFKEICVKDEGELVLEVVEKPGGQVVKVVPFSRKNGVWLRSFSLTSGYSYLKEESGENLLKNM